MEQKIIEHTKLLLEIIRDKDVVKESIKTQYSLTEKEVRKIIDDIIEKNPDQQGSFFIS